MHRPEWQLCDIELDPLCTHNLAGNPAYADTLASMQQQVTVNANDWSQLTPFFNNFVAVSIAIVVGVAKRYE